MIDFIFFDPGLRDQFVSVARQSGIECVHRGDGMGMIVSVAEDLPDQALDALEEEYEALMEAQSRIADDGDTAKTAVGIHFLRGDGKPCLLRVDPDLANRLLSHFSPQEIDALIAAILDSADNPERQPLCKKPQE